MQLSNQKQTFFTFSLFTRQFLFGLGLLLFLSGNFSACKKENEKPKINVLPGELRQFGQPGDLMSYQISVESNSPLRYFRIYLKAENQFEVLYMDSALSTKNFSYLFEYLIPNTIAGKLLYIRMVAINENGDDVSALRQIDVGDGQLQSFSGLKLRTRANSNESAFNLETLTPEIAFIADSSNRDLQEFTNDTSLVFPTRVWYSPSGGKFAKSNNFDFTNATYLSVKNAFTSSIQSELTDSLSINDIYIFKLGSTQSEKYLAIRLVSIVDSTGSLNDYYLFDVKK